MVQHEKGLEAGKTCIDCHKGIVHLLPASMKWIQARRWDLNNIIKKVRSGLI